MKELKRRSKDKIIGGVASGMAEYFGLDVVLIRLAWVISVFAGFGIILYLICLFIIPEEKVISSMTHQDELIDVTESEKNDDEGVRRKKILGYGFIAIGTYFFLDEFFHINLLLDKGWPIFLIALGAYITWQSTRGYK